MLLVVLLVLCVGAAHASPWWERQVFVVGATKVLPVASYTFTDDGGSIAFKFKSRMFLSRDGPVPLLLVCNDIAMGLLNAPSALSGSLCGTSGGWRAHCAEFAFPINAAPLPARSLVSSVAPFRPLRHRLSREMLQRLSPTLSQLHFLVDACKVAQNSTVAVQVTVDYCICDAASGDCAGTNYSWHRGLYVVHALAWVGLALFWLHHLRVGPRQCIHAPLTIVLCLKVVHTAIVCAALDPSLVADELLTHRVGRIADLTHQAVAWIHLMVVFSIADGFGTLWLNVRGCLFAVPFCGFPTIDDNVDAWNPVLAGVIVSAIVLVVQSLASKRQRVLFAAWMAFEGVGIDPTTTSLETKRRLLHRFVRIAALYFAVKFVLDVVFLGLWDSYSWLIDAVHETLLLVQAVALGKTFRCREFNYPTAYLLPAPPRSNQQEGVEAMPADTAPKKFVVFSHPDGTTAYGEELPSRNQSTQSVEDLGARQPSIVADGAVVPLTR